MHLGIAFQLIDDALDYRANPEELGKNLGDDLADGKPTLPLIYAIEHGTPAESTVLRNAIENGDRDAFREVYEIVEKTDAIAYTSARAIEEADKAAEALKALPASEYKDALISLARFSVERSY
jgi:octaprenyl-diphosphate synthase